MSKIKITQIFSNGDDCAAEYLDDKGRVWYQEYVAGHNSPDFGVPVRGHYVWRQIDLPEDPDSVGEAEL